MKEKLQKYLDLYLNIDECIEEDRCDRPFKSALCFGVAKSAVRNESSIINYIDDNKEDSFNKVLFKYIDDSGLSDSEVYNKVNIDRRLFSKIRNENYHPSKETVILLGIALELDEDNMDKLLESASYSLPKNTVFDLIIRFCFKEKIYDINKINEFLYEHNCKVLNG